MILELFPSQFTMNEMHISPTQTEGAYMILDHLNTGIMGLNSVPGMDVCHFSVLCCSVYVEAL